MNIEIISKNFQLIIYGFGSVAANKDYAGTAFKLSGRMWEVVKGNSIKSNGKNIWVYDSDDKVFAGIELDNSIDGDNNGLDRLNINLKKYAYYKHIGNYSLIKQAGQNMTRELKEHGFEIILPYIEIYGHYTGDENKSETELLMCLK